MKSHQSDITRRAFIGTVAAAGAASTAALRARAAFARQNPQRATTKAPDGRPLTAGLIGCGGRGCGAAANFVDAGPNLRVTALADVLPDRVSDAQKLLKQHRGQEIPDNRCFTGFDAYQKLLATDVDVVIHATPPHFRPLHMPAAIDAKKHLFMEKPISVDVPGAKAVMQHAERAASLGLSIMTGTQLRRELNRIEVWKRVRDGAIGDIRAVRAVRNQGALWYRAPEPGWSEMEYMIRDWVNWAWLSGDIVVEMHIHHIDAMYWIMGKTPTVAVGMGARVRRKTGDQYDFFNIDYKFDDALHMQCTIRQLNGCASVREEVLVGTKGSASLDGVIYDLAGKQVWKYEGPSVDSVVQEHADWVTAIRSEKPINTAKETAISTLIAIMGRDSAYTGKDITWEGLLASNVRLGPTDYTMGVVNMKAEAPVSGVDHGPPLNAKSTR
jgi:myo-inositol 2-dehydrogenase / D-chiro-inositol 1-dehydrogenase